MKSIFHSVKNLFGRDAIRSHPLIKLRLFRLVAVPIVAILVLYISITAAITSVHSLYAYVKILSPNRGQTVPIDSNLKISGDSIDNSTSECQVSVIVNDIKPYQNATASGPGGPDDFSKWDFVMIPQYTTINEGTNKITSRLSCVNVPAVESPHFYSINITGTRP